MKLSHIARGGGHLVAEWILAHFDDIEFFNGRTAVCSQERMNRGQLARNELRTIEDEIAVADCYVLRDPFNNIASKLKASEITPGTQHGYHANTVDLWVAFAERPLDFLLYNRFVVDPMYRLVWATKLQLPNPELNPSIEHVNYFGGGSSFDGMNLLGSRMQVFDRWRLCVGNAEFEKLCRDTRIRDLAVKYFGWYIENGSFVEVPREGK